MQAILLCLSLAAAIGVRGHRTDAAIPRLLLLAMSIVLAAAFLSRRVV
jgi:hypothetical protein